MHQKLVKLAKAAATSLKDESGATIIYPTSLTDDVPNKIVAQITWETFEVREKEINPAQKAKAALLQCWKEFAQTAKDNFSQDKFDEAIWSRQIGILDNEQDDQYLWEVYWAVAKIEGDDYSQAYLKAEAALQAAKRNRTFIQYRESGFKDTLSGKREALHDSRSGRKYWEDITQPGNDIVPIKVRPNGRERLDAIGLVKRFSPLAEKSITPF
ncbi:MAG: hypothetical protein HYZ22_05985, partial [Chloroflexi bacterium]|nr:hypothetical protein [Chloroflexota bacterium]